MSSIRHDSILMFDVVVSILGLFIVLLLAFDPPITHESFFWRKTVVGLVFSATCLLGVFAALFPKPCTQMSPFCKRNTSFHSHRTNSSSHHPACEEFSAHVIHLGTHVLCAACTGLIIGALGTLFGVALYFFGGWYIEELSFSVVLVGVVALVLGFLQFKFRGFARLMLNAFFVLGAFLILAGIDALIENLVIDLFLVAFIVFWILTRIQISQWDHWRICRNCESPCEVRWREKE